MYNILKSEDIVETLDDLINQINSIVAASYESKKKQVKSFSYNIDSKTFKIFDIVNINDNIRL